MSIAYDEAVALAREAGVSHINAWGDRDGLHIVFRTAADQRTFGDMWRRFSGQPWRIVANVHPGCPALPALEPVSEDTACCDGTGLDGLDACTVCFRCDYCGNVSVAPLTGRDEDGDPVHVVCAPGGAFRVAVEAYWAARSSAAALVGF